MKKEFRRFEFKYIINNNLQNKILDQINNFIEIDSFAYINKNYFVKSLYFDNNFLTAFHEKIDGLHTRKKFRIRCYDNNINENTNFFIEQKGRYNNTVYKKREPLDNFYSYSKSKSLIIDYLLSKVASAKLFDQFYYDYYKKKIFPISIIEYYRTPYFSKFDRTFRITFDKLIKTNLASDFRNINKKIVCKNNSIIMEIKFENHIPVWFHNAIKKLSLNRQSISKVCQGLIDLNQAKDEQ